MKERHFLAIDLGATSGRAILGTLAGGRVSMNEIHRFPNGIVKKDGHSYWDFESLLGNVKEGLRKAASLGVEIDSIGVDTWGVDVVFFGKDGKPLGMPYSYRDTQTDGVPEAFFKNVLSREALYARTGIQVLNINTLFQLYSLKLRHDPVIGNAAMALFMPDAISYMLTGKAVCEYTIASTSHFLNPNTKDLDAELLSMIGVDRNLFPEVVMPGTKVGILSEDVARECGLPRIPVVAVAGHDTASAVAAVPASNGNFAYLSSGTWSLLGVELDHPVLSAEAAEMNITNEGGVDGTITFLKNITGMWILENVLKEWAASGKNYSYPQIVEMAESSAPRRFVFNPDDPSLANPASMLAAIDACFPQGGPNTDAEYVRSIFDSLAARYRTCIEDIRRVAGVRIDRLHIIGGGSKNALLNKLTQEATGIEVVAGPAEATAFGNIMLQAAAVGAVNGLWDMRRVISASL